jgi:hypothetical protein
MFKGEPGVSRVLNLDHQRHSPFGAAKRERLACVLERDRVDVLADAIRTPLENLEMAERTGIMLLSFSFPMLIPLTALFATLSSVFRSRTALQLENLALRHQIGVLQRTARKRPKLTPGDRLLWVWLSSIWSGWRSALAIVKPETVIAWHRVGFRLFWTWKVRRGRPGRPVVFREVRELVRRMCRENPSWGAPRVHGELLKLGIDIGESSVSKYMVHCHKPPSQT